MPERKVLIIGNGFDLAHDLPTSYDDFLKILKGPAIFKKALEDAVNALKIGEGNIDGGEWNKYLSKASDVDMMRIDEMLANIDSSSWAKYYANCNADINGWIDFEREILPAIRMFQKVLDSQVIFKNSSGYREASITTDDINLARMVRHWPKFFPVREIYGQNACKIQLNLRYFDEGYGILKEKLLDDLYTDFRGFITAFGIYIGEIVDKQEVKEIQLFKDLKPTDIINFNYTATHWKYYSPADVNVYYVHGSIVDNTTIVMGVNEVPDDEKYDFKEYEKSTQRLFYDAKQSYKDIIESDEKIELYIFGHSLDATDKSILEPFLRKAAHVTIYYYDDARKKDYYNKIKNVMALLGDNDAEDMMRRGVIEYEKYYE